MRTTLLREELLNLCVEMGATGVKVTDKGKVRQDHAVAVRGVVAQLASPLGTGVVMARGLAATPQRVGLSLVNGPVVAEDEFVPAELEDVLWRIKGERPPWPSDDF